MVRHKRLDDFGRHRSQFVRQHVRLQKRGALSAVHRNTQTQTEKETQPPAAPKTWPHSRDAQIRQVVERAGRALVASRCTRCQNRQTAFFSKRTKNGCLLNLIQTRASNAMRATSLALVDADVAAVVAGLLAELCGVAIIDECNASNSC